MLYYQVRKEFDNAPKIHCRSGRTLHRYKSDIWIENELYTPGEINKLKKQGIEINYRYFNIVDIPKNKTYFFFGARFAEVIKW